MNSSKININKIRYEVAVRVVRYPLPPYYETFLNNLTYKQTLEVTKALENCGELFFILHNQ